jgi:hypothetical protein
MLIESNGLILNNFQGWKTEFKKTSIGNTRKRFTWRIGNPITQPS